MSLFTLSLVSVIDGRLCTEASSPGSDWGKLSSLADRTRLSSLGIVNEIWSCNRKSCKDATWKDGKNSGYSMYFNLFDTVETISRITIPVVTMGADKM